MIRLVTKTACTAAALGTALLAAAPAQAGSAAQPGQTVGLPVGAQLPVGLYFVNLSSFGVRDTLPRDSESNVNLPTLAWSTPRSVLDARLQFFFTQPVAAPASTARPSRAASASNCSPPNSPGTSASATCSAATCRSRPGS